MFKIGEYVQATGVWKATEGGGPRREGDGRCRSSGRSGLQGPVEHYELGRADNLKSASVKRKEEPAVSSFSLCLTDLSIFFSCCSAATGFWTRAGLPAGPSPGGWATGKVGLTAGARLATP